MCSCREVDLRVGVQGVYVLTYIASSSAFVAQRLSNLLLLSLSLLFFLCLLPSRSILQRPFVEAVTMNSWLVTVLLLASAANGSGGQSAEGGGGGEGGCDWSIRVSPHRCTSAHHKLHMYTT